MTILSQTQRAAACLQHLLTGSLRTCLVHLAVLGATLMLTSAPAHAMTLGELMRGGLQDAMMAAWEQRAEDAREMLVCKVCLYSEPDFKGSKVCAGENDPYIDMIRKSPIKSWQWRNCKDGADKDATVTFYQGIDPGLAANAVFSKQRFPSGSRNIDPKAEPADATGWSYASYFKVRTARISLAGRAESLEMELPYFLSKGTDNFDPQIRLPHSRRVHVAYATSRPHALALRGATAPPRGERAIGFTTTDLPGNCEQTVLGSANMLLPKRSVACHGAAHLITAKTVCTIRAEQGYANTEIGITPLLDTGPLVKGPMIAIGPQPVQVAMASHFKTIRGKKTAAWFYNDNRTAVQIECAG